MHKRIMFRCMAHSKAIEGYISKKVEKLQKFFKRQSHPISVDIVLEPHREKHFYKVECKLDSGSYHVSMQTQGRDMYVTIDQTMRKIVKDIIRRKEKPVHGFHQLSYA